jgi:hypothetical protein
MQSDQNPSNCNQQKALALARAERVPRDDWQKATTAIRRLLPMHVPLRKFDREAPRAKLLERGEERPEWCLTLWPFLYRFYDADLRPVYIGISSCHATRLESHRKRSAWWPLAEYIAISVYATYEAVLEAERAALRRERPRFNKQGVRGPARVSIDTRETAEEAAALLFRQVDPTFVAELAALLAQPERFPQPPPPPPARFADSPD